MLTSGNYLGVVNNDYDISLSNVTLSVYRKLKEGYFEVVPFVVHSPA